MQENIEIVNTSTERSMTGDSKGKKLYISHLVDESKVAIPSIDDTFTPFGDYDLVKRIIETEIFFPIYIVGEKGFGKSTMIEQACARSNRLCIRVPINIETDSQDLFGGPELIDGNTVNRKGPVLLAMEKGAVLMLDEFDRASLKIMCLQSVLEGKEYFDKNTGQTIYPKKGFTIIATANTKGRGNDDGKYSSQIIDDATLDRFKITIYQNFPSPEIEKIILLHNCKKYGVADTDFVDKLILWATQTRKSSLDGSSVELISTRRLVYICEIHAMIKDRIKSLGFALERFEPAEKKALIDFYLAIDNTVNDKSLEDSSSFQKVKKRLKYFNDDTENN